MGAPPEAQHTPAQPNGYQASQMETQPARHAIWIWVPALPGLCGIGMLFLLPMRMLSNSEWLIVGLMALSIAFLPSAFLSYARVGRSAGRSIGMGLSVLMAGLGVLMLFVFLRILSVS